MRFKRLVAGVFVCGAAAIAACFGGAPNEGTGSQLVLQPGSNFIQFGSVQVGMTRMSMPITISSQNAGDDDTLLTINEGCGDFSLNLNPSPQNYRIYCDSMGSGVSTTGGSGATCIPNSYTFTANFTPVGGGSSSCTVTVTYKPTAGGIGDFFNITLQGTGVAATSSLSISPPNGSSLQFGNIPAGDTSSTQRVTITNTGTQPLISSGSATGPYSVAGVGSAQLSNQSLGAGQSASYDVRCVPQALGPQDGTLSFSSAAPQVGLQLKCNGVASTGLSVTPNPGNFPATLTGKPVDQDVTITNTGGTAVVVVVGLSNASSEVTLMSDPDGQTLGSGSSTTAKLHYAAATDHPMSQLATLNVNYVGGTNLGVAINGEALPGSLGVSPGMAIDFGPVCVGATATQPVSLYASAAGTIDVSSISAPSLPFTATSTNGTLAGNHGNSLMLEASVTPTAAGDLSDKLVVHTSLATADQSVTLTAKALPAGVTPTPDVVHFGPNRVGMTTTAREIIVSNCSASPITFTAARIEGADAADFALVSELPAAAIDQRAATKLLVIMTAHSNGGKQAQLVLEHAAGTVSIALDGNGFAGDDVSNADDKTYYSCNAGGASAFGAVFGVGLVAALRRRRRK